MTSTHPDDTLRERDIVCNALRDCSAQSNTLLTIPEAPRRTTGDTPQRRDLLPIAGEQVLLVHPPIYDTRLHWARWQQPIKLLRLGTYCRKVGAQVQLIDMVAPPPGSTLRRQRVKVLSLDDQPVNKWRFGALRSTFDTYLRSLRRTGWQPDRVYVECATTFWWEGAAEVIECVKRHFPGTEAIIVGAYAEDAPSHALDTAKADAVLSGDGSELAFLPTDLSLYPQSPRFAYLSLGEGRRPADDIIDEIVDKHTRHHVQHFAFADHDIAARFGDRYSSVLDMLAGKSLRANFYAIGNISAADIVAHSDLAYLLRRAGYTQIFFSDDRNLPQDKTATDSLIENYRQAAALCAQAGFPERTENLSAGISLGRAGENLSERARLLTLVTHHIGAVIMWPYLPTEAECPDLPLEDRNGKLFPLRHQNGYNFRDYLNIMGLAAVLNSKYRTQTFDFLGDGLIPRLFRDSVAREAWDADPQIKGTIKLPFVVRP